MTIIGGGAAGRELIEPADRRGVLHRLLRDRRADRRAVAPRMIKLQLELGGKDPAYVMRRRRRRERRGRGSRTAPSTTPGRAAARSNASTCTSDLGRVRRSVRRQRRGFKVGDPSDEDTYIGPLARRELRSKSSTDR